MTQNSRPTLKQIMDNLENKTYSSYEITQEYLNKIEKHNDLNSYIYVDKELALEKANEADKARGNAKKEGKKLSPLTGVPIAQKDIFCTTDLPTTCGSKMLEDFISPVKKPVFPRTILFSILRSPLILPLINILFA